MTQFRQSRTGYLFILPAFVLFLTFFAIPFAESVYYSLTSWNGADPEKTFVGIDNYIRLAQDPKMWESLGRNLAWVVVGTLAPILIGLLLAALLASPWVKGRIAFRTIYFLPVVLSPVVIGLIWSWIYHPTFGILNHMLESIGLSDLTQPWLGNPDLALWMVMLAAIWSYFGFCLVVLMAGMQSIDTQLYDAAMVDGANAWNRFFHVTLPQLNGVITMIMAYTLIGGLNVFDLVWVTTQGGPANSTELIATYTYKQSFQLNSIGYGSALSMVMTVLSLVASYLFLKLREEA